MRPTLFLLLALCLIAGCKSAEDEYEYEDESVAPPSPPVTPAPAKAGRLGSLLSPRGRIPPGRKPSSTTSTTPKAVEQAAGEEIDEGEEFLDENQEQEETSTTTTEASKRLRAGGVRPFRSNQELLETLKRRRAQVTHTKEPTTHSLTEPTTPKSKSLGGRSRVGASEATSKPTIRGRYGGNNKAKGGHEEVEETQQDEVQVKPKPIRRG